MFYWKIFDDILALNCYDAVMLVFQLLNVMLVQHGVMTTFLNYEAHLPISFRMIL